MIIGAFRSSLSSGVDDAQLPIASREIRAYVMCITLQPLVKHGRPPKPIRLPS